MLIVPADAVEETLRHWVADWLDLLAAGRAEEACARLDGPGPDGRYWTPQRIADEVARAYGPGTRFRAAHHAGPVFTPVASARGAIRADFGAFQDGSGFWVDHDVPLNGEASDLTAQFVFERRGDAFRVMLRDLHVL
jgi:hypothetical protein